MPASPFAEARLVPHYPSASPLADLLALVPPGTDSYKTEGYAAAIQAGLVRWGEALRQAAPGVDALAPLLQTAMQGTAFLVASETPLRSGFGVEIVRRSFRPATVTGRDSFLAALRAWLGSAQTVEDVRFEIGTLEVLPGAALAVRTLVRYNVVGTRALGEPTARQQAVGQREQRTGTWQIEWVAPEAGGDWQARRWQATEETLALASGRAFTDITATSFGRTPTYAQQIAHGVDHWRTVLDGASGIDVYGNNGIAAGDFDGDGFDDLYVCQPAGLPNRLYRNRGDGSFDDVTERAGVGVLDNTACALFADLRNVGLQDLVVVTGGGPLLFLNQGDGTFRPRPQAFQFARPPQGTFTHAALADYDRDGRLDLYLCTYQYYLGLDQYHYPVPYIDARNGPPNVLLHNEGDGRFVERTEAAGLNVENTRYSFACAWGDADGSGLPDLCVANDFGRTQLYRNNGDGTFTHATDSAHLNDVAAGMGACWADLDNDGRQDVYTTGMWDAAGQRVAAQAQFHAAAPAPVRALYTRHASGNALYRNQGDGTFQNVGQAAGAARGGWSWGADAWDFDHDGYTDLYVTNGYITGPAAAINQSPTEPGPPATGGAADLASFFWRQVVARSPDDATPSLAYERGWNAINELIRSDHSWNGNERNVLLANHGDGTFTNVAGLLGLDLLDDSRSFALADLDHDGRLEVVLKNRSAPQLRVLHNNLVEIGDTLAVRLRGHASNRDAIGAAVTVECGPLRQTKYLQAGSGFLAQHSKELFFGLGRGAGPIHCTVRWPNGLLQRFEGLPRNQRIALEEGVAAFKATPFAAIAAASAPSATSAPTLPPPQPASIETWLIEPLAAPEFSLPDGSGTLHTLEDLRAGGYSLLHLWSTAAAGHREQLVQLDRRQRALAAAGLSIVAVNVDQGAAGQAARSLVASARLTFATLYATEEVAGIYNILYRYLFDRRRDLALPSSFLLDRAGRIVKLYQGLLDLDHLQADLRAEVQAEPLTADDRLRRALPMPGQAYLAAFQRNDFTYGVALFQHGYLDQAAAAFAQVVAAKPNDAEGYYNLGTLSLRRNDLTKARGYLQQTVMLRPDYPEAWNNLGMIAAQQGQPEEAIRSFQRSLQLRPAYATALLNLGNLYRRQHEYEKAQTCLSQALALQPDDPETNYNLGMLYAAQEQTAPARQYLEHAIELRPGYPEARNNLGILFVRAQDYARAEAEFKACIQVAPAFDQSYLNLARLDVVRGDRAAALQVLNDLLRLQPTNRNALEAVRQLQAQP